MYLQAFEMPIRIRQKGSKGSIFGSFVILVSTSRMTKNGGYMYIFAFSVAMKCRPKSSQFADPKITAHKIHDPEQGVKQKFMKKTRRRLKCWPFTFSRVFDILS